jgi:sorbitol-specific phosphotransferase system component IIBC
MNKDKSKLDSEAAKAEAEATAAAEAQAKADAEAKAKAAAEAKTKAAAIAKAAKPSAKVVVDVYSSIAFDGLAIRPKVDASKRDRTPIVSPVRAVIPRVLAEAVGPKVARIVSDAADDAPFGVIQ